MKDRLELNSEAISMRKHFGADDSSPIHIFSLLGHSDSITLVLYPMGKRFAGMSVRVGENGLIAVNSGMSYGRQRLSCAHGLYHLYHQELCKRAVCLQDLETDDPHEMEANRFASYFIAPYEALREFIYKRLEKNKGEFLTDDVVRIEQYFGFSRQAVLKRLLEEDYLTLSQTKTMMAGAAEQAARLGFDPSLYAPSPKDKSYQTFGKYIQLAEELKSKELISTGKYEELMLSAFRYDMVFGGEGDDDLND